MKTVGEKREKQSRNVADHDPAKYDTDWFGTHPAAPSPTIAIPP